MSNNDKNNPKNNESQDEKRHQGDAKHNKEWHPPKKTSK